MGVAELTRAAGVGPMTGATVVRGVLNLRIGSRQQVVDRDGLLDAAGRKVMDFCAGANDVSRLSPGVYFVKEQPQAASHTPQSVRKVIVPRLTGAGGQSQLDCGQIRWQNALLPPARQT
jgi:hypothetical protein